MADLRSAFTTTATQLSIRPVDVDALPRAAANLVDQLPDEADEALQPVWLPPGPGSEVLVLGRAHRPGAKAPLHLGVELRTSLDAVDRGTQRHIETVDALAGFLRRRGIEPSPGPNAISFDLGWERRGRLWISEIKSTVRTQEAQQLRLGLGQVLDYRQRLTALGSEPRSSLVVEREPTEPRWTDVCSSADVVLAWPGAFDRLVPDEP